MLQLSFEEAVAPVREDFKTAHESFWDRLASPGSWWSGPERVAIAAEIRHAPNCELCKARKDVLSPNMIKGEHDTCDNRLPAAAIDVIHRVTNDSGRLSKIWFEQVTGENGISDGQYVELIGTIAALISIDKFCRGVGASLHPLPTPYPGEPTRYRPPGAKPSAAWVPMIQEATGDEADLYGGVKGAPNVMKAMSLVPDEVRTLKELSEAHYLHHTKVVNPMAEITDRAIDRAQIELVAGRVSALRGCYY